MSCRNHSLYGFAHEAPSGLRNEPVGCECMVRQLAAKEAEVQEAREEVHQLIAVCKPHATKALDFSNLANGCWVCEAEEIAEDRAECQTALDAARAEVEKLATEVLSLRSECFTNVQRRDLAREDVMQLTQQLSAARAEVEKVKAELTSVGDRVNAMENEPPWSQVDELTAKVEKLSSKMDDYQMCLAERDALTCQNTNLVREVGRMAERLVEMGRRLEAYQAGRQGEEG